MKIWIIGVCLLISLIVLVAFGTYMYQLRSYPLEESVLEKNIADQVNKNTELKSTIEVEVVKDIGNLKTFLFSVHNKDGLNPNLMLGFAFYEKSWLGHQYRSHDIGWGTNTLDSYLFEASTGKKKETFLVVYGMNPSESKEFERFTVPFHGDTLVGDLPKTKYFVKVFPVDHDAIENGVTSINFETKDHDIESFPLIMTSRIK